MTRLIPLLAADRFASPWKNGGGTTSEVAVFPGGATMDDFQWRVSIAEVTAPGAFSNFPQVDRVLAVIEGRLSLRIAEATEPVLLSPAIDAHGFPGDIAAFGEPLDGPVRDLNVMVRRGAWEATTRVLRPAGRVIVSDLTDTVIFVAMGETLLRHTSDSLRLGRLDAAFVEGASGQQVELVGEHPVYVIRLSSI